MKKPTSREPDEFTGAVSLATAARRLGVPIAELRRRLGAGELRFVQVRGQIKVPKEALAAPSS